MWVDQLERVCLHLDDVVQKGVEADEREDGHEEGDERELDDEFTEVVQLFGLGVHRLLALLRETHQRHLLRRRQGSP